MTASRCHLKKTTDGMHTMQMDWKEHKVQSIFTDE